jgi:molybdopterin synthase catalytic subunit
MIRVQREDFDPGAEIERLTRGNAKIGGVASFIGLVRDVAPAGSLPASSLHMEDGAASAAPAGHVGALTLEHYPGMTEKKLAEIEADARARWPLEASLIIHRTGRLEPGARIVLVVTASAHRTAALEACHFLIDWLKTQAPFWKTEDDGQGERWVEAHADDDKAAAAWSGPRRTRAKKP